MKIIIEQFNRKIIVTFKHKGIIDKYKVDKAEDFLACIDKFLKKSDNIRSAIAKANLEFIGTGMLTERITRAIISGLRF